MGLALGQFGLSLADFDALTPSEFSQVARYAKDATEHRLRDNWERTRQLATIVVQPFCKKKLSAKQLMRFPWDNRSVEAPKEKSTKERFEKLVKFFEEKDKR